MGMAQSCVLATVWRDLLFDIHTNLIRPTTPSLPSPPQALGAMGTASHGRRNLGCLPKWAALRNWWGDESVVNVLDSRCQGAWRQQMWAAGLVGLQLGRGQLEGVRRARRSSRHRREAPGAGHSEEAGGTRTGPDEDRADEARTRQEDGGAGDSVRGTEMKAGVWESRREQPEENGVSKAEQVAAEFGPSGAGNR